MATDPTKFWRDNAIHHQNRADFWQKTSRVLAGILVGILIVLLIAVKVSS